MKYLFKYILLAAITVLLPSFVLAQDSEAEQVKKVMVKTTKNFYDILNDKNNNKKIRKQKVLNEVGPLLDFNLMARLALNKKTWKSISKSQRSKFSEIFIARIKKSYLDKLDIFSDIEVVIENSKRVKKNRIEVTALLKTKADTKKLVYKFYQTKKKEWLIYDISIVGVSFLQSYRSQFSAYLKNNSFDDLIKKLKDSSVPID